MNCNNPKCNNQLSGQQKKYCSKKCKQYMYLTLSRQKFRDETGLSLQSKKGLERKINYIKLCGGGCKKCGYNKNITALEFHHKDPNTKTFTLDLRNLSNRKESVILKELDKCELLCSNCHQELHNPQYDDLIQIPS